MHTTCKRCNRALTSTTSQATGYGRTCLRRERAEQTYTATQREKAAELIEDGGIAATPIRTGRGRRVFAVVASSGTDTYFTTCTACTCPAGLKGRRCYHRLSVVLAA